MPRGRPKDWRPNDRKNRGPVVMGNEPEKRSELPPREPTAAEVAAYLRGHPDFLVRNPDLLGVLTPPSRRTGDTVVDMQQFMVERQRREIDRQKEQYRKLDRTSTRLNSSH